MAGDGDDKEAFSPDELRKLEKLKSRFNPSSAELVVHVANDTPISEDLASFLNLNPDFVQANKVDPKKTNGGALLRDLQSLPVATQEQLLVEFFTKHFSANMPECPNGEKLAKLLVKINNIPWLEPSEEPNTEVLQRQSDAFLYRLHRDPLPIEIIKHDYEKAIEAVDQSNLETILRGDVHHALDDAADASHQAEVTSRVGALYIPYVRQMAMRWQANERDIAHALTGTIGSAIEWTLLEDALKQHTRFDRGNPLETLYNGINDKGYVYLGPTIQADKSVIFVPPIV